MTRHAKGNKSNRKAKGKKVVGKSKSGKGNMGKSNPSKIVPGYWKRATGKIIVPGKRIPFQDYTATNEDSNDSSSSSNSESLQNTSPGKKLNLISSTRPDGGHSTDSNDSVASTEIQPVGNSAYDEGENDVSMVPDLESLNPDPPTSISSGSPGFNADDDEDDFLPNFDSIMPDAYELENEGGNRGYRRKITDDPVTLERREKNRVAASECRKRQKEKIGELEGVISKQKREEEDLLKRINDTGMAIDKLKTFFKVHATKCPVILHKRKLETIAKANAALALRKKQNERGSCQEAARSAAYTNKPGTQPAYRLVEEKQKVYAQLS